MTTTQVESLLRPDCVRLDAAVTDKRQAIALLGQLLAAGGCTDERYGHSMAQREALADTFLGAGVAIPHGRVEDRHLVRRDGLAVLQIPGGIEWNPGQRVRLVVGIAARSDGHIAILKRLTGLIQDEARLRQLAATRDPQDIIAALTAAAPKTAAAAEPATDLEHSLEWIVSYPSGLHARPASTWAQAAQASGLPIRVRHGADSADARSLVDLLQLGLTAKARVVFSASGSEAPAALAKFLAVVNGLTAQERSAAQAQAPSAAPGRTWQPVTALAAVTGVAASAGLAVGRVRRLASADAQVPDRPAPLLNGKALLEAALAAARQETQALADATAKRLGAADAAIFQAQAGLLDDVGLITDTCQLMAAGHGAAWAWHEAVQAQAERLSALGNPMLAARAADLRDVGLRALRHMEPSLAGDSEQAATHGDPVVLIAADLAPSDTAALDIRRVAGLATTLGGPTSHTAILARTLGLPAIVAAGAELLDLVDGAQVIIDGDAGRIHLSPTEADLDSARAWIAQAEAARQAAAAERQLPANTGRPYRRHRRQHHPRRTGRVRARTGRRRRGPDAHRIPVPRAPRHARRGRTVPRLSRHAGRACRPTADRQDAGHRRRQAGAAPGPARGGKPLPGRARRAPAAAPPRSAGTPTARTLPRRRAGATCPSCFPWSHRWPNCFSLRMPASACAPNWPRPGSRWAS